MGSVSHAYSRDQAVEVYYLKMYLGSDDLQRGFKVPISSKTYSPNTFEDELYKLWNENGCFLPKESSHVFSMILPPPNVTGSLHLGHSLTVTIQDVLSRWWKSRGSEVVWVPGTDHAGIATQVIVEKVLEKTGTSRQSIGRESFVNEVWKWRNNKSSVIGKQLRSLGSSLDWSREYFTMDEALSKAVNEALLVLWNKGLIYREETIVNWSPYLHSTISDIEVDKKEIKGPIELSLPGYEKPIEFGKIYDVAYKVVGTDEEIIVSTTRIETIFGDVAVAVHPEDERYRHLWGSVLVHPFTASEIPLILDFNVDKSFGSGALKITPAHDRTDFLIGKLHNLPFVSVINEDGCLINSANFSGMRRYDARHAMINSLAGRGLLRGARPHTMNIPICSRSGDVVEMLMKPQWFLKCKGMAEKALLAVKENKLILKPERLSASWVTWLENIQDWCISRQLWWGHQVPFYCCESSGKQVWYPARNEVEASKVAKDAFQGPVTISRCPDVLDTWFSSSLLPFSCFGWPQKTGSFDRYYPLSTLVTGNDILFFWVARMVMLGLELTDQLPFKEVLLHGIICDSNGRKMSKSLGNTIDPDDIIKGKPLSSLKERIDDSLLTNAEKEKSKNELAKLFPNGISECGVDALRFTLLSSNIKNQYININIKECEGVKRFCNKLWQVCNFTVTWLKKYDIAEVVDVPKPCGLMNRWILIKLVLMLDAVNTSLPHGDFHISTSALRSFLHHDLCDVYVESIKPILKGKQQTSAETLHTLAFVLVSGLKCLSPFMPFVTELLYHMIPGTPEEKPLMEMPWPSLENKPIDNDVVEKISLALKIVDSVRRLKHNAGASNIPEIMIESTSDLSDIKDVIETLGHCSLKLGKADLDNRFIVVEPVNERTSVFLDVKHCSERNQHTSNLLKKSDKMKKDLEKMLKTISNEGYKKVPAHIKKSHQEKVLKLKMEISKIAAVLDNREIK